MELDFQSLHAAQEQVESGGNPLAVSPKGAIGPMQTMPATLKDPGLGVKPAKDSSIDEQRRVGKDYSTALVSRYGDKDVALAAYNWGMGNVDKWLEQGGDRAKLPKETQDYILRVNNLLGRKPQKPANDSAAISTRIAGPTTVDQRNTFEQGIDANSRAKVEARPTFLEMAGAAIAGNTTSGILGALMRPKFEPEDGFIPDMAKLPQNTDSDLLEHYSSAKSSKEAQEVLDRFSEEQLRLKTVGDRGVGAALALGLGAEIVDPLNMAMPYMAAKTLAKVGMGSEVLFRAGKVGAGYTSAIGENLISGTALEATKQSLQGDFKPVDLGVSLVADGLIGAGSGWLGARHAANTIMRDAQQAMVRREADLAHRAEQSLGRGATVEDIRAKMKDLHATDIKENIKGAFNDVPAERWVMPKWNEPNSTDNIDGYTGLPNNYVTDSGEGLSQRPAPTTPEFISWFGNSKVTNADGTPRIVYHGTVANFDTFSHAFLGSNTGASSAREGFFFAGKPTTADAYSQGRTGSNTMAVYLNISNPLVVDLGNTARRATKYSDLVKQAKANGHDGLIIKNTVDGATVDDIHVVFDQTQIKSAIGNSGAYSPNDPRINYMVAPTDATKFAAKGNEARVGREITGDAKFTELANYGIFKHTDDFAERSAQLNAITSTPGVHLTEGIAKSKEFTRYATAIEVLRKQLIPDVAIHLTDGGTGIGNASGAQGIIKPNVSMVAIKPGSGMRVVAHEFAHAVFAHEFSKLPIEKQQAMVNAWETWKKTFDQPGGAQEAMLRRSPVGAGHDRGAGNDLAAYVPAVHGRAIDSLKAEIAKAFPDQAAANKFNAYFSNFDEYSAEQMVKQFEAIANKEADSALTLPQALLKTLIDLVQSALKVFKVAKEKGFLGADAPFKDFIEDLVAGNKANGLESAMPTSEVANMAVPTVKPASAVASLQADPDLAKYGLSIAPMATAKERQEVHAMLALHKEAEVWAVKNPMDAAWVQRSQNLSDNDVFNVASIGLVMLKSQSPLVRRIASMLVEDASGVAGKRQATAAISKAILEHSFMGNAINDVQGAFAMWSKDKPGIHLDNWNGGKYREEFNKEVAVEIEMRRVNGKPVSTDANIKAATDSVESAYQRMANEQRRVNTLGSEGLPLTSQGYMPHRMSAKQVIELSNEKQKILHDALHEQFIGMGWDKEIADKVSANYIQRMRDRASGDYSSAVGGSGAASQVEEALHGLGLPEDVIKKHMDSFVNGGMGHTKKRIELDLLKSYDTANGSFRLLDIFDTDHIELVRGQAGRISGEVALTKFGVRGKPGAATLRKALGFGADGERAGVKELEAFDQMMAEFYNEPFGTASGKWLSRALSANSLVRMGGSFFNQAAETINGVFHIGAAGTMSSIASIPRLHREIMALVRGEKVDNPFLSSIEHAAGGVEFGTEAYKYVMPFDSPNHAHPTYGKDTLTLTDRLLRGGGHLQGILSGWRYMHSAQQRGMAEQIVHKMMRYIRDGKEDVALEQFGINKEVRDYLRSNLSSIASFDGDSLVHFDATKIVDPDIREQVIQSVWRGTSQIIQGTYIGERGKWAHDGWTKMLTQFRAFPITAMEKQWGRSRNSHGSYATMGMMIGAMSLAAPVYMARVYANSIGRSDQEAYISERLQPDMIARATLNYVATSGMAGDFVDALTAMAPQSLGIKSTGGRNNKETDFVGTYVAPAAGLVNDIWHFAQSPTNMGDALKIIPLSRLPGLVIMANQLKD